MNKIREKDDEALKLFEEEIRKFKETQEFTTYSKDNLEKEIKEDQAEMRELETKLKDIRNYQAGTNLTNNKLQELNNLLQKAAPEEKENIEKQINDLKKEIKNIEKKYEELLNKNEINLLKIKGLETFDKELKSRKETIDKSLTSEEMKTEIQNKFKRLVSDVKTEDKSQQQNRKKNEEENNQQEGNWNGNQWKNQQNEQQNNQPVVQVQSKKTNNKTMEERLGLSTKNNHGFFVDKNGTIVNPVDDLLKKNRKNYEEIVESDRVESKTGNEKITDLQATIDPLKKSSREDYAEIKRIKDEMGFLNRYFGELFGTEEWERINSLKIELKETEQASRVLRTEINKLAMQKAAHSNYTLAEMNALRHQADSYIFNYLNKDHELVKANWLAEEQNSALGKGGNVTEIARQIRNNQNLNNSKEKLSNPLEELQERKQQSMYFTGKNGHSGKFNEI